MPKRDDAYMAGQRDLIARAAFECLLEKGVAETSIREICNQAGVSIGAFYTHFSDKEQVTFAACQADLATFEDWPPASTWRDYTNSFAQAWNDLVKSGSRARKRLRLNFQFVGELALYEGRFPGFQAVSARYFAGTRDSLERIHAKGEIELPLGGEQTAQLHARLYYGSAHALMLRQGPDEKALFADLLAGLAIIAGLKTSTP
jgi:AcrR family transcriptional regulator